ncbi:MAG: aminotransferase class IV [Candidatus Omnitrophica bacterium]|nr:aminotransferase class IV [Candidatus Omnitrophota bacterium]MBU1869364.1 aminotransferase class IV [Candidatus Omnitrophota bacterium]
MARQIYFNGKFIKVEEASIPVLDPGFLFGLALFETMRWHNGRIVYFDAHLKRIRDGAKSIGLDFSYSCDRLKTIIKKVARLNRLEDGYVKMLIWRGQKKTGIMVIAKEYVPHPRLKYKKGFSVCISNLRKDEGCFLSGLKSTNRILYQLSMRQAEKSGFDEALILNSRGYLSEASRSNIFFAKDSELFTPGLECACLPGITRKAVFDLAARLGIKVYEGNFTKEDLSGADEAFLTNSLMGIMPLTSINGKNIGKGKCGYLTRIIIRRYNCLLK